MSKFSSNQQQSSFNEEILEFNPVKGDVSDSELNAGGGQFDTTSDMNEGVP